MADVRHRTVIDVDLSTDSAEAKLARIEAMAQRIAALLGSGAGGGMGGPGGAPNASPGGGPGGPGGTGGGAPNASPGGGGAPALPPPGGGGGGAPTPPGPAPAPAAPNAPPGAAPGGAPGPGQGAPADPPGSNPDRYRRLGAGAAGIGVIGIAARHDLGMQAAGSAERQAEYAAAADISIAAPFNLAAQRAQISATRDATSIRGVGGVASAIGGLGAGALAGAQFGGLVGALAGGAVAAIGSAITELFATRKEQEGAEVSAALGAAGQAISFRAQIAGRRATFDSQNAMLGFYGGGIGPGSGAGLGLLPEESMAAMTGFGQAAGFSEAFSRQRVLAMSRSSVSPGAAGSFRGMAAAGAGGIGNVDPAAFIGLAQLSGLAGSKAEEYLARIVSTTTSMAQQGMKLDITATERFLNRIAANEGEGNYSGLEQSRAAASLVGTGVGARNRLLSPYANVVENATFMQAIRSGGGSTMGTLRMLEHISSSPERVRKAALSNYGSSTGALGFAALGNSVDMSELLANMRGVQTAAPMDVKGGGALSVARARAQAGLLGQITDDDTAVFDAEARIQIRALALGSKMVDIIEKLETTLEGLNTQVEKVLKETDFRP